MIFANSLFLSGMLLGVLPLVIHLAGRKKSKTIQFPSLRFLVQIDKALARRYKLRELLILFMRVSAICLLAAGLALPRIKGDYGTWIGSKDVSTVFVIDNSMSAGFRSESLTTLKMVKQTVLEWIGNLGEEERSAVVPVYGLEGKVPALSTDHQALAEKVSRIEPTFLSTGLGGALHIACKALEKETSTSKQIIVFSDFSQNSLPGDFKLPEKTRLFAVCREVKSGINLFINDLTAPVDSRKELKIRVRVENSGDRAAHGDLILYAGKKEKGRKIIMVPPRGMVEEIFALKKMDEKRFTVRIESAGDCLDRDNSAFISIERFEEIPVLFIKERESVVSSLDESFYLRCALSARSGRVRLKTVLKNELSGIDLEDFEVVFLVGLAGFKDDEISRLKNYIDAGGVVFFVPGEAMDMKEYRALSQGAFPVLPCSVRKFVNLDMVPIGRIDEKNGVIVKLSGLRPVPDLRSVRFRRIVSVTEPKAPDHTVLGLENGMPLLIEKAEGRGLVFFFTAGMTPQWSTFPLRIVFVEFFDLLVQDAASRNSAPHSLHCGQVFPVPRGFANGVLSGPQGELLPIAGSGRSYFGPLLLPGIYKLADGAGRVELISVNTSPGESRVRSVSHSKIKDLLSAEAVISLDDPQRAVKKMGDLSSGKDLRNLFLLVFLAVCSVEGILSGLWSFKRSLKNRAKRNLPLEQ